MSDFDKEGKLEKLELRNLSSMRPQLLRLALLQVGRAPPRRGHRLHALHADVVPSIIQESQTRRSESQKLLGTTSFTHVAHFLKEPASGSGSLSYIELFRYWFPLIHMFSLTLTPNALIGLTEIRGPQVMFTHIHQLFRMQYTLF